MVLKFPGDVTQLPPYRALRRLIGAAGASHVWVMLWQELYYRMQAGNPPGRLFKNDVPDVVESLGSASDKVKGDKLFEQLVQPDDAAPAEFLLVKDGEDFLCPRFCSLYTGASAGFRNQYQRAADAKHLKHRLEKLPNQVLELGLQLPLEKFRDEAGKELDGTLTQRIIRLIVVCDNVLFRPYRPTDQYSESLIQNALALLRAYTDEQIDTLTAVVGKHRDHPLLQGKTTEKLLDPECEGGALLTQMPTRLAA